MITGGKNKEVNIWNFKERILEANLQGHTLDITKVLITNDNKFIISGSYDKTIRL